MMVGEFYKAYHIVGISLYDVGLRRWTSKATIYPPVKVSLAPTVVVGTEGAFTAQEDAEKYALRMGKEWVDRHSS
jgi:hypothetical protein